MLAVLVTAVVTWALIVILSFLNVGSFLLDGTIAVVGGFLAGMLVPWFMVRRARARR